jgi:predicted ATPase/signal transduction histidine kinase
VSDRKIHSDSPKKPMQKQTTSIGDAAQTAWHKSTDAWINAIARSGYQITEQLYAGSRTLVYRAIRESDSNPVILKLLQNEMPTFSELVQFRNQYAIIRGITDRNSSNVTLPGIIQAYSLEHCGNGWLLAMEDFGGISLSQFTQGHPLEIATFSAIAIQLADILHYLYQHRVIHKDIKPANILIHPVTKQVKLIDFSIASLLPRETQEIQNTNVLEGTLAYLSPEQTGRMNRGIDYRSDFYALGVTFYQLLAGKLPFASDDPMELIHCHLAVSAIPVHRANPKVPAVLSQIVAKLMAKNAEDRYQSAIGLKHDLEICLHQWNQTGTIADFAIAQQDRCDRFTIPEKLYGREPEVQVLLDAFERVFQRDTELMLVAGVSGIGKTVVIHEVHKPIVRQRGYFIKGKFDQFNRNIPFWAFVQALRDLMGQLLSESDVQLAAWKANILAAVGENGQLIVDVIPELERIIGKQLPVPELSGSAAQNRFNLIFKKFISVFTTKEHPLVMFLDDLQWADSASLNLLNLLISEARSGYLLILGAYRDNEVFPAHPLMLTLEQVQKAGATVNTITLEPLEETTVNQLVADTLSCTSELAQPLTQLVYQKTKGNPFFTTQFLKALQVEGWIEFQQKLGYWQCDMTAVRQLALSDDVVEFMALQLQKLPIQTQEVLKLAACIGNQFDLNTLAIVSEKSETDVATLLWKALQEELILPTNEVYKFYQDSDRSHIIATIDRQLSTYKFLHDRVQQAAYTLIPEEKKQATHLKIGQLWLSNISSEALEEKIFEIVNQLNIGTDLITDRAQINELAQLNRIAGQKAKSANAYEAAVRYFNVALELLNPDGWTHQYHLMFDLHLEAVNAEYLTGNFQLAQVLAEIALKHAKTLLERVSVYEQKIQIYIAKTQFQDAINTGLQILDMLGIQLEKEPPEKLNVETLINLPLMTNPNAMAALRILDMISNVAYMSDSLLSQQLIFTGIKCCIQYGNSPLSAPSYNYYSIILCGRGEMNAGYQLGQLAADLSERFDDRVFKPIAISSFNGFIRHWKEHIQTTIEPLREVFYSGREAGELVYSGYAILNYCNHLFFRGVSLELVKEKYQQYLDLLQKQKLEYHVVYGQLWYQVILNLLGLAEEPLQLTGLAFQESAILPILVEQKNGTTLFALYVAKSLLLYLLNAPEQALACAREAEPYKQSATGLRTIAEHNFYYSLALLTQCSDAVNPVHDEFLNQVAANQAEMQVWMHHAPMNFQHKYDLVEGERYRVLGNKVEAIEFYDTAITGAKENGYIQEEALANELAAKFYLDWGKEKVAAGYMQEAYYCYSRWGAKAKIKDLETRYRQLLSPILQRAQIRDRLSPLTTSINTLISTEQTVSSNSTSSVSQLLDLAAVLKAAQALSSEIHLDKLLATLMQVIVENSGADKAALFLDSDGELEVVIKYLDNRIQCFSPKPVDECKHFPTAVIHYVERTLETLIPDVKIHPSILIDSYFIQHQPQSLLCTPILNQGKLIGVLYLENSLAKGAFTKERVELLKLLCAQAAISLANARLYQQSQTYAQQVSQKSQQLEQTLQELQTMQLQLVQNEKMSALGNLVAGVAHEINNPVGFLKGNIQPALDYIKDLFGLIDLYHEKLPTLDAEIEDEIEAIDLEFLREDLPKLVGSMSEGVDRIASISTSLRTFSRADSDTPVAFNLHEGLDSTILILKHRLKANENRPEIKIIKNFGNIPKVECFAGQLNQVFMNLLANAIDALEESNTGRNFTEIQANQNQIAITTKFVADRNQVLVRIKDNGTGMCESVKHKIFDHLFTTKAVGKGTGLGLAIAHQIVTQKHNGFLEVNSTLGQGSEFTIALPVS